MTNQTKPLSDIDKSLEILRNTNGGNSLSPSHLTLVEGAVNGHLTDKGIEKLDELYKETAAGTYQKPWFHRIENITTDGTGYIYWKDEKIEHLEHAYAYSSEGKERLQELSVICQKLEEYQLKVNIRTVVLEWDYLEPAIKKLESDPNHSLSLLETYILCLLKIRNNTIDQINERLSVMKDDISGKDIIATLQQNHLIIINDEGQYSAAVA